MGVDTVSVGLRHKLRVNRPLSFFEDVSNAYNANVRVVYYNCNERRMFTLFKLKKESAIENLLIYPPECQYLQQLATPNVSSNSVDWESEALLKQLWDAICQDGGYYEISGFKDNKDLKIEIYRETVYIGLVAPFRWYSFLENFTLGPEYHYPDDASMLQDYRKELCRHAQSLGCDEVIYIADQDAGELIFDQIDKPVNDLLNYIANRGFYKEMDKLIRQAKRSGAHQFKEFDVDWATDTEQMSKFVDVPDFFLNKRDLISDDFSIDVLFDDFRDLKNNNNE